MDIDKELLKILDIKPSLQELPEGGYTITDYKKEQVEKIKALFALREVVKSLPNKNDVMSEVKKQIEEMNKDKKVTNADFNLGYSIGFWDGVDFKP